MRCRHCGARLDDISDRTYCPCCKQNVSKFCDICKKFHPAEAEKCLTYNITRQEYMERLERAQKKFEENFKESFYKKIRKDSFYCAAMPAVLIFILLVPFLKPINSALFAWFVLITIYYFAYRLIFEILKDKEKEKFLKDEVERN